MQEDGPHRRSRLQESLMRELAAAFKATIRRIEKRLESASMTERGSVIEDELRGLYHGVFVTFDGGSALADSGTVSIVDDEGITLDRGLHESCFDYWPADN